jgi:ribosome-binding protein aMBF1 (putative translation factor)
MAKVEEHVDKKGNRYVRHEDVMAELLKTPADREAYMGRRRIHEIAAAVKSMRERAGLSQYQLADLVKMKQPAIARIETSQHGTPQWKTLDRIALALNFQLQLALGKVADDKPVVRFKPSAQPSPVDSAARSVR